MQLDRRSIYTLKRPHANFQPNPRTFSATYKIIFRTCRGRVQVCLGSERTTDGTGGTQMNAIVFECSLHVTPRDRCARCLPVIRCCCRVIFLRVASCHVILCIASSCFSKLASVPVSQFFPLSVLSPDTLARARGTSEILFYKWPENVLGMG